MARQSDEQRKFTQNKLKCKCPPSTIALEQQFEREHGPKAGQKIQQLQNSN